MLSESSIRFGPWEPEVVLDDLHADCSADEAKLEAELALAKQDLDAVLRWTLRLVNVSRESCGHATLDVDGLRSLILGAAPHRA